MWMQIAMWVALTVLGELLRPKTKRKGRDPGTLEFPDNRQDRKIPLFAGTVQIRGPLLPWYGDLRVKAIKEKVKSGMFSSTKVTVGYRYYAGMQLILGHGPIDAVTAVRFGRKSAWTGSAINTGIAIDQPTLFGEADAEGGVSGTLYVHDGALDQAVDAYLAQELGAVPAHGGVAYVVWSDAGRTAGGYLGNSKSPPEIWITARRLPRPLASGQHNINGHANPAEFLYELHTHPRWGAGMGVDQVDTASFLAAANTLYNEGFGLDLLYTDAQDVEAIMLDVLEHIDGLIYTDIATGKRVLTLARADYVVGSLPTLDETNSTLTAYSRPAWDETTNEVHVTYTDTTTGDPGTVLAQDLANQQIQQAVVAATIQYPGLPTAALAQKVAYRDLRNLAYPQAKCTVEADRIGATLRPGMLFKLDHAALGIAGMVMRVNKLGYGTLTRGRVRIDAVQDLDALTSTIYGAVPATGWANPTSAPAAALYELLLEAPYHLVRADPDASGPEVGKLLTWAAAPAGDAAEYGVWTRQGTDAYQLRATVPLGPTGTLTTAITPAATSLTLGGGIDLDQLNNTDATGQANGDNLALIGNEWISYRTVTDNGNGTVTLGTVYRGALDTVPAAHSAGARVRILDGAAGTTPEEYALTASVNAKYTPRTGQGTLALASAAEQAITLTQRVLRPYPPARVQVNGASYPQAILGAYALTWLHRDRTQQLTILDQPAASIGPETGTTYTLRLYGETDTLLRTETGLTGTGYTWTAEEADSGLTVPGAPGAVTWNDDFNRATLGSDWTALHFDGTGSVTLDGAAVTVDSSGSGDFWQSSDSGSIIYRPFGAGDVHEATVKVAAGVATWSRLLMARKSAAANSAFAAAHRSGNSGRITPVWRSTDGAAATFSEQGAVAYNSGQPLWIRAHYDGAKIEFWTSQSSATGPWNAAGSVTITGLTLWCLCDSNHGGATVYDDFEQTDSPQVNRLNGRIRAELESVRGGLTSHQRHNITTDRAGWGYQWGNYWGGL